jgi:hypothetical protein
LEGAGQDLHDDLISSNFAIEDKENFNISKFLNKLLEDGSSYRIDDQLGGDIEFLYTFQFEDTYEHGDHYNRVKLKSIEVDQDHQYGRGGKKKYKTLSEFQDDINKARKENS